MQSAVQVLPAVAELTASGWYLDEDQRISGAIGDHADHVHGATFDKGGCLQPGMTMAYNGTGQPERVSPVGGEIDYVKLADRIVASPRHRPPRAYGVASDFAKGLQASRKR